MKRRAPRESGRLLGYLKDLIRHVDADTLTEGDRAFIRAVLRRIAADEDPRDLFFKTVRGTGKQPPQHAATAAHLYWARIKLKRAQEGKAATGRIARLSGLTDDQVDHAARRHKHEAESFLAIASPELIASLAKGYARDLVRLRRAK